MLLTLMWLGVAVGMGSIISAAMRIQEEGICNGYQIKINGFREDLLFTSESQIENLLKAAANGEIKGQRMAELDLAQIEDLLEQSSWVYNADLYFDNNSVLHVDVTERKPLARVFTEEGASFYIDEAAKQIPLSDRITLDLPVFTGYPSKNTLNAVDSTLIQNVIATASFINSDPFWNAQVGQINISSCGVDCWKMEMIPVVGNHKVDLGDGSDIVSKFHRLYLFYSQVLSRTGFDKYRKIDVQYDGQVIGVKDHYTKIDSIQLRKNIEKLLQESRHTNELLEVAPQVGYDAIMPLDSLSKAEGLLEEEPEIVSAAENVAPAKDSANTSTTPKATVPPVVKKEADGTKKEERSVKEVKPAATTKPVTTNKSAVSKKADEVAKKETGKRNVLSQAAAGNTNKSVAVKKADSKNTSANSTKKTEASKTESKKPVTTNNSTATKAAPKKDEGKKNVLLRAEETKKADTKKTTNSGARR
ncbi:Cell division protein FtsQ [Mycovorax composti]|uniref:Cell division protein FtsQ n=2 Tax=Mycovorax composti TaxID=2962693 RepID=A0ABZ2EG84_9BACT